MTTFKHRVRFYSPGSLFAEDESREIPERTVEAALAVAPQSAFMFQFYDTAVVDFDFDAGLYKVIPIPQNESGKHYIGGQVYTCDELRNLARAEGDPKKYDILISNVTHWQMEGGYTEGRAIRCRTGNWQEYNGEPIEAEPVEAGHGA